MAESELTIVLVYGEILGTYGDRGNALALVHRARARDLPVRLVEVELGQPVPEGGQVYLLGGGEDSAQHLAIGPLSRDAGFANVLAAGLPVLAVCAGFQLLGRTYAGSDGSPQPGLGVLDVTCGRLDGERAVGEVVIDAVGVPDLPRLTGFENHFGTAVLGSEATPLGRLVHGVGNGDERTEGAVQGGVVATYLHGPVLVRNPALADHLLERSTGPLAPFDDALAEQLRRERLASARDSD